MRKPFILGGICTLIILFSQSVNAQQFGIGVGVASSGTIITNSTTQDGEVDLSPTSIYLTFRNKAFRLEGEFGILRLSATDSEEEDFRFSRTGFHFGLGVFYSKNNASSNLYLGARIGRIFNNETYKDGSYDEEDKRDDTFIAPTLGFEYNFDSHFSLGGEVQVNYLLFGNVDSEDTSEYSILRTRTIIFVRYYF